MSKFQMQTKWENNSLLTAMIETEIAMGQLPRSWASCHYWNKQSLITSSMSYLVGASCHYWNK